MSENDLRKQLSNDSLQYLEIYTYRSYKLFGRDYFCDICLIKDKLKDKIFVRLQKRWFGISKKMQKEGQKSARWIIIRSYNFPQEYEFNRAKKILNDISLKESASINNESIKIDFALEEISKIKNKVEKLEKKKNKDRLTKNQIIKFKDQIKFLDEENKKLKNFLLQTNIPKYKEIIKTTLDNLNSKTENDLQKLFKENSWLFGPNYEEVISKKKADVENQPDFILKRYDGFADVVEIESPTKELFTKPNKSNKMQPRADLMEAIAQVMDYIDSYNEGYLKLYYQDSQEKISLPLHAYYPTGVVIIGTNSKTDKKKLKQLNHFLHDIKIMTHDDFLKQAERMIQMGRKS